MRGPRRLLAVGVAAAAAACHSAHPVYSSSLATPGRTLRVAFGATQDVLLVGPGGGDSLRAEGVARIEGRLLSVSGDTLRLRVDRAYSADGRSFQLPNGATGSVIRDADTRMDERRVSAGRTTALVAGVAAGAFLLLLAAALAAIADGVD